MKYKLIKNAIKVDGEAATTYGVTFGENKIEDISTDKDTVIRMVEAFNENNLSVIHLNDVIEDYLAICQ